MNQLRQKIATLSRIQKLEQSKFDALAVELSKVTSLLVRLRARESEIQDAMMDAYPRKEGLSISGLNQKRAWMEQLQSQKTSVRESIESTQEQRQSVMDRVRSQKAKLDGWNILITQLDSELASELEKREQMEADDHFLSRRS